MLKVGDIVRIKEFKPGRYDNIYHGYDQVRRAGEIHLVRAYDSYDNTYILDLECSDTWWSAEVLEKIAGDFEEGRAAYYVANGLIQPVIYDVRTSSWCTDDGCARPHFDIWMGHSEKKELSYDIYGVGVAGDTIDVINIRGFKHLAPKYLPMYGRI